MPLSRTLNRLAAAIAVALAATLPAHAFETSAKHAFVYDMTTDTVLLDKDADTPIPPASMSKLMTIEMLFEALEQGVVTLDTTLPVSAHAKSMGGSTMFLNEMDTPTIRELMQGMVINSGNDACVVVAEGLSNLEGLGGSEAAFAAKMTERAKELGLTHSHFANASGWPDPGQRMSVHDLGMLAAHIIKTYPQYYPLFGETTFDYKNRAPANASNRNPLLALKGTDWDADGMKTGHTEELGYGLVGSAKMGDRRIVFILGGMQSEKERAQQGEAVANWAFHQFTLKTVAAKGTKLAEAPVWMGATPKVAMVPAADIRVLMPNDSSDAIKAAAVFDGPIKAPIKAGDKIGKLVVTIPGVDDPTTVPLVAASDVAHGGFFVRVKTAAAHLLGRAVSAASGS